MTTDTEKSLPVPRPQLNQQQSNKGKACFTIKDSVVALGRFCNLPKFNNLYRSLHAKFSPYLAQSQRHRTIIICEKAQRCQDVACEQKFLASSSLRLQYTELIK